MFVLKSTYDEEVATRRATQLALTAITKQWNDLVARINSKGGEAFLDGNAKDEKLTKSDVTKMLILCHPDKHNGKKVATEITAKLNVIRSSL